MVLDWFSIDILLEVINYLVNTALLIVQTCVSCLIKQIIPHRFRSKSIDRQICMVTGTGSGIGRLVAVRLAKLGATLVCLDVNEKGNEKTVNEILVNGGKAHAFTCDLSSRTEIYRVAEEVKKTVGNVQILVNNAGVVFGKSLLDLSDTQIETTFQVNTLCHFWLAKSFLPHMLEENDGHIVTIASIAGVFGSANLTDYSASKFGAVGFDESLRHELKRLGKDGVQTTVVCPYYTNTGMFEGITTPGALPLLEPSYVADKIVEAILTNQGVLMLPRIMYFFYFIKGLVSHEVSTYLTTNVFKTNSAMDTFVGRKKVN